MPEAPRRAPEQQGGLSSAINLAPMAGPFMSEAFALGSVYQPVLSIAGLLLAEIEPIITANLPDQSNRSSRRCRPFSPSSSRRSCRPTVRS